MAPTSSATSSNAASFERFLECRLARQHNFLEQLLRAKESYHESRDQDVIRGLIDRVVSHYQEYLIENKQLAKTYTYLVLTPTWLSPLEKALLWIAGIKPGLIIHLLKCLVSDLSEDQGQRIESLKIETRMEEKLLEDELASTQESLAPPLLAELAREEGRRQLVNREVQATDIVLETLRLALQTVIRFQLRIGMLGRRKEA